MDAIRKKKTDRGIRKRAGSSSFSEKWGNDGISNLLSELQNEIIVSITEQTELESDSLAIMLGGGTEGIKSISRFPEGCKN